MSDKGSSSLSLIAPSVRMVVIVFSETQDSDPEVFCEICPVLAIEAIYYGDSRVGYDYIIALRGKWPQSLCEGFKEYPCLCWEAFSASWPPEEDEVRLKDGIKRLKSIAEIFCVHDMSF